MGPYHVVENVTARRAGHAAVGDLSAGREDACVGVHQEHKQALAAVQ